jgi:hypothetical protein
MRKSGKYRAVDFKGLEPLRQGHFDNTYIETPTLRVRLSRMTVADGMPYDNQITEEVYDMKTGCWVTVAQYPG